MPLPIRQEPPLQPQIHHRKTNESTTRYANVQKCGPIPQNVMSTRWMIDHVVSHQVKRFKWRISILTIS